MAAGYDFDTDFAGVDKDGSVTGVTRGDILAQEDLKVVIIKANTDVKIDGKILYVSCDNVTVTGKDSVSIKGNRNRENLDHGSRRSTHPQRPSWRQKVRKTQGMSLRRSDHRNRGSFRQ
ncbi:MAG: hypothetical protein ACLR78_16515 [Roseburia sp.]